MTRNSIPNQETDKKEEQDQEQEQNTNLPPSYSSDSDSDSDSSSSSSSSSSLQVLPETEEGPVRIPTTTFVPSSLSFPTAPVSSSEEKSIPKAPEVVSLMNEPASISGSSSAPPPYSLSSSISPGQEQNTKEDLESTRRNYDVVLQNSIARQEQEDAQARQRLLEDQQNREKALQALQQMEILRLEEETKRAQEENAQKILRQEEERRREQEAREEAEFKASVARIPANIEFRARREEEKKRRDEEQKRIAREDALKIAERQRQFLAAQEEKLRAEREKQERLEFLAFENDRLQKENRDHLETISRLIKDKALLEQQLLSLTDSRAHDLALYQLATQTISRLEAEKAAREQEKILMNSIPVSSFSSSSQDPLLAQTIVEKIMENLLPKISSMIADSELNIIERTSETEKTITRKLDRESKKQLEDVSNTLNEVLAVSSSSRTLIEGQRNGIQEAINQGRRAAVAVEEVKNNVLRGTANIMAQNDLTKQTIGALATALTEREVPQGLGEQEKDQILRSLRTLEGDRLRLENRLSDQDAILKDLSAQVRQNNVQVCDLKEDLVGVFVQGNQDTSSQIMRISSLIEAKSRGQFKLPNKTRFNPTSVAVSSSGDIFAVDHSSHCLHIFDWQGLFVKTIGSEGEAPGQFLHPSSVSVSSKDEVLVCDKGNGRLQIFDAQGNHLQSFGSQDYPGLGLTTPFNACFDERDFIFVCDQEEGKVFVFNSEKFPLFSFSGPPTKRDVPFSPTDVLVHNGIVYISEFSSGRIILFTIEGELIKILDRLGLKEPNGLAFNSVSNELIISESGTRKIVLLDLEKFSLSEVDKEFEGSIEGIALDLEGNLLVCDSLLHTIHSVPL